MHHSNMNNSNGLGTVGRVMLNQGLIWLSLGYAGTHPLAVNMNENHAVMVLISPSSCKQMNMLSAWYAEQFASITNAVIIDCRESSHSARMMLTSAIENDNDNILIISPSSLFDGVRSDARMNALKTSLTMLMHDDNKRVMIVESFTANAKLIGDLCDASDAVMTVGSMTPVYSQLAFGSCIANGIKGKWDALMQTANSGFQKFSLKGRIPVEYSFA